MPKEWENGNDYKSFAELMTLVKINDNTYESGVPAYSPGGFTRAYGGHCYAQAPWAAAQTVKRGFNLHSVTGWFILQGDTSKPFKYHVEVIREGGSYCQRQVNVTQDPTEGVCFTCICSFKRPEKSVEERQLRFDIQEKYDAVLKGKRIEDWPECPGIDSPFFWEIERQRGFVDQFPGLNMRKVDMEAYNRPKPTLDRRQLQYYKVIGDMPEDPNLHACAHLYASDRNGLFPIPNFLDVGDNYTAIASLNHTVILHVEQEEFSLVGKNGEKRWFLHENAIDKIGHGRAMTVGRLLRENGVHVATCFQDGMLRLPEKRANHSLRTEMAKSSKEAFAGKGKSKM